MEEWIRRCSLSPLALVLGILWRGPSTLDQLRDTAKKLYQGSPRCWNPKTLDDVVAALIDYGLVARDGRGSLKLERQRLHPVTRTIAEKASQLI
ncbi:MAG: hypothetical protein GSR73_02840 [Desulfurococcales archaeon]|nr:hypothetical protein [Desulfurococcales archaeon]